MGEKQLTFAIQGEFITKLAREWLFYEGKDMEKNNGLAVELYVWN